MPAASSVVLVTGCSSGSAARWLAISPARHTVIATARRVEDWPTSPRRLPTLPLDVTDRPRCGPRSTPSKRARPPRRARQHAGYSQSGAANRCPWRGREPIRDQRVRPAAPDPAVLRGAPPPPGRIVNVSSMGGRLVFRAAASTTPASTAEASATRCATSCAHSDRGRADRNGADQDELRRHRRRELATLTAGATPPPTATTRLRSTPTSTTSSPAAPPRPTSGPMARLPASRSTSRG